MKNLLLSFVLIFSIQIIPTNAQQISRRTVTGLVVDESREPLIFANVIVKGPVTGTQTDLDGKFSISFPDTCHILQFHYPGLSPVEVDVRDTNYVYVMMLSGIILDQVIITDYKVPLIEQDNTTTGGVKTENIRGSRNNATNYYIDGIRVTGSVTTGGTPRGSGVVSNNTNVNTIPNEFHTEDYDLINDNIFHSPEDAPLSTFSIDVDAASYSNLRRYLMNGDQPPKDAARIEEMVNYFDYDYPQPMGGAPVTLISEVGICPWNPAHQLVHLGLQGKIIPTDDLPPSNLVFLIDVSGSMNVENKLPLVIASFKILIEHLREKDLISIVVYAGSSGLVLQPTSGSKKDEIYAALDRLHAGGPTGGAAGIKLAYLIARQNFIEGGNNRVILATDGDFNVGVSSDGELVELIEKERESDIFLTVLGFGMGNYKDNKMQKLADHGNGNHGYVDNLNEARKIFVNEFGGTLFTIAKDVKIQVEFNPAHVEAYRLIGYENRLLEDEDFNNDQKDAGEIGSGHSVTALYEIIPVGTETASLHSIDELKYQKTQIVNNVTHSDELMTVKLRYKEPEGDVSHLVTHIVTNTESLFDLTSENFRWAASVALFGMLLRESEFSSNGSIEDVRNWASQALGNDVHGYRKEFLKMVKGYAPLLEVKK